jgi:hypothetical protein
MGQLSDADRVWNRAAQWQGPAPAAPGDRALAALMRVIGRDDLAELLRGALGLFRAGAPPGDQDARGDALMALGDADRARLEQLDYEAHPEDFAPLEPGEAPRAPTS